MRKVCTFLGCVVALGVALLQPSAAQQPQAAPQASLADTLTGAVRSDYDAGRLLFEDQDYAGALLKFERAYQQMPDERLLWNMAACEKNLRHYGRALELLERYRSEGEGRMSPAHREEVIAVVDTLRSLVSRVHLRVSEPDAQVFVDDQLVGRSPLPKPVYVDLGLRRIRAAKSGFVDQVITQEFSGASELTLLLTLAPEPTDARITIVAEGSSISIDGNHLGRDRWEGPLPAGEHTLRVTAPDMHPYVKEIVVRPGEPRTLYVQLTPDDSGGLPAWVWVGAGVVAAGGLAAGAYYLLREPTSPDNTIGTLPPHVVKLPLGSERR